MTGKDVNKFRKFSMGKYILNINGDHNIINEDGLLVLIKARPALVTLTIENKIIKKSIHRFSLYSTASNRLVLIAAQNRRPS